MFQPRHRRLSGPLDHDRAQRRFVSVRARVGVGRAGDQDPSKPSRRAAAGRYCFTPHGQSQPVSARHRSHPGFDECNCRAAAFGTPHQRGRTMYVAVKVGERAIENAHRLLAQERRGDPAVPEFSLDQIGQQLTLAVDRVMNEGSLYDRELAALAIKQARGDLIEAIFLLRAFRATLPRFGATEPVDTGAMQVRRRISSTFKDVPGGQVLGPTFDYTHRLLDPELAEGFAPEPPATSEGSAAPTPRVTDIL